MILRKLKTLTLICLTLYAAVACTSDVDERKKFSVCWSIYVGWMPWGYGAEQGIVKKWADKYGIDIDVVQVNDYIESINQYNAGRFDACAMTNMDALTIPAASGVDSTALIVGDFSNGNDGIVVKDDLGLEGLKGKQVNVVELSVSHYLLARALESVGMSEQDLTVVNTADADMVSAFTTPDVTAVVTWNPLLSEIREQPQAKMIFDSSDIPGEIIDLMVVNSKTLADNPDLGKALVGAWYEIMSIMSADTEEGKKARQYMANASGTDLAGYEQQLASTRMFYQPDAAVAFTESEKLKTTMQDVSEFSFKHGQLGAGASDATFIGIATPAGTYGDKNNVQLRFDPSFMQMAADGKL